jgi:hypothetical protein
MPDDPQATPEDAPEGTAPPVDDAGTPGTAQDETADGDWTGAARGRLAAEQADLGINAHIISGGPSAPKPPLPEGDPGINANVVS